MDEVRIGEERNLQNPKFRDEIWKDYRIER